MQTWAKRGVQTALVTGGLLVLGTGIASANENVNPDRLAAPIDGGVGDLTNPTGMFAAPAVRTALPAVPTAAVAVPAAPTVPAPKVAGAPSLVPSGTQEATSLRDPQPAGGDRAVGPRALVPGARSTTSALSDPTAEWRTLTGDLAHVPPPNLTQLATDAVSALSRPDSATVFRVPTGVLGQAIDRPVAPPADPPATADAVRLGPPKEVDRLLQAVQVPRFADLLGRPVPQAGPQTMIFPAITDGPPRPQDLLPNLPAVPNLPTVPNVPVAGVPVIPRPPAPAPPEPRFAPMSGELPLGGHLTPQAGPSVAHNVSTPNLGTPTVPALAPFQGLPPLPTLPPMPALPRPGLPGPQAMPAGSAQQLIAELRTLTNELANRAGGTPAPLYPMTPAPQLPDLPPTP